MGEAAPGNQRGWLVGPWFDLLLIANVGWPLVLLLQTGEGFASSGGVQFWQIYFLTTPHRWITLALVFLDGERFAQRWAAFLAILAAVVAVCMGVQIATGTLLCLLAIDYVWNAWHFAAQHHGIYRIYSRRGGSSALSRTAGGLQVEKWGMRLFLLYVILRVAGTTWPYVALERGLGILDWLMLAAPAWLVTREGMETRRLLGRAVYLGSVLTLYVALLMAVHFQQPAMVLALATASAVFHATEYLALVSWKVQQRQASSPTGLGAMNYFAPRWGMAMGMFVLVLGSGGWMLTQQWMRPWLLINVIVAFLHYAYDGMIWRGRA